jgi:hypothetical protein
MKIRSGFVSNSSSSSFIVAQKVGEVCKCCGRSAQTLLDMFSTFSNYTDNSIEEDWKLYLCDKDILKKGEEYEKNGYKVFSVEVSYHDEKLSDFLKSSPDIEIIREVD